MRRNGGPFLRIVDETATRVPAGCVSATCENLVAVRDPAALAARAGYRVA